MQSACTSVPPSPPPCCWAANGANVAAAQQVIGPQGAGVGAVVVVVPLGKDGPRARGPHRPDAAPVERVDADPQFAQEDGVAGAVGDFSGTQRDVAAHDPAIPGLVPEIAFTAVVALTRQAE